MLDHPKANPATSATPTPALYDHAPIFLAITAYAIPVPKNRTYTITKVPAFQFHPSTICDATNGTINRPQRHQRHTQHRLSQLVHTHYVLPNDSHQRHAKDPQREPEQSPPSVPVLPAQVVKCLRHPLAEPLTERPRIQPQQHRIARPVAPARDVSGHAPNVLPPPPPRRETASAPLPAPSAPRLWARNRSPARRPSPARPPYRFPGPARPPSSAPSSQTRSPDTPA